jgi:hypothetical protein
MNRKSSGLASLQSGISAGLSAYAAGGPVKHFADTGLVGRSSGAGARWTGVYDMYGDQEFDYSGITQPGDITQYFGDWYTPTEGADWLAGAGITDSGGSGGVGDESFVLPEPTIQDFNFNPFLVDDPNLYAAIVASQNRDAFTPADLTAEQLSGRIDPVTLTLPDYQSTPGTAANFLSRFGNIAQGLSNPGRFLYNAATGNLMTPEETQQRIDRLANLLPNETLTSAGYTTLPDGRVIEWSSSDNPGFTLQGDTIVWDSGGTTYIGDGSSIYTSPTGVVTDQISGATLGEDSAVVNGTEPAAGGDEVVVTGTRDTTTPYGIDVQTPITSILGQYGLDDTGGGGGGEEPPEPPVVNPPVVNSILDQYGLDDTGGGGGFQAGLGVFRPTGKKDWGTFTMPTLGPYRAAPLVQTGTDTSSGMSFQTYAPGALDDYLARLNQFQRGPQTAGIGGVGYQALPGEEVQMAAGGIASLPEYRAGGKLLTGPGDGMSDSIPAVIKGEKPQRAALADGEFVVPADVVSHLGNGSTKAGADTLYAMMDRIRQARTGRKRQAPAIDASDFLPA